MVAEKIYMYIGVSEYNTHRLYYVQTADSNFKSLPK